MASSGAALKRKKVSMAMQLPPHVQTNLIKEDRLLQQSLEDLEKKTRHRVACIIRDQQVAGMKLRSLQIRLLASQNRSFSMQPQAGSNKEEVDAKFYKCFTVSVVNSSTPSFNGVGSYKASSSSSSSSKKRVTLGTAARDGSTITGSHLTKTGRKSITAKTDNPKTVSFSK